jgi:hypothetical protein
MDELKLEWIWKERLLHVFWATVPIGQHGHHTATDLLILRSPKRWMVVHTDTHTSYERHGGELELRMTYTFAKAKKSTDLILRAEAHRVEWEMGKKLPLARESAPSAGAVRELSETTEWPCQIKGATLVFGKGVHTLTLRDGDFPIQEVVQYVTDTSKESCDVDTIRKLNKQFWSSDMCSGAITVNDRVPPHKLGEHDHGSGE